MFHCLSKYPFSLSKENRLIFFEQSARKEQPRQAEAPEQTDEVQVSIGSNAKKVLEKANVTVDEEGIQGTKDKNGNDTPVSFGDSVTKVEVSGLKDKVAVVVTYKDGSKKTFNLDSKGQLEQKEEGPTLTISPRAKARLGVLNITLDKTGIEPVKINGSKKRMGFDKNTESVDVTDTESGVKIVIKDFDGTENRYFIDGGGNVTNPEGLKEKAKVSVTTSPEALAMMSKLGIIVDTKAVEGLKNNDNADVRLRFDENVRSVDVSVEAGKLKIVVTDEDKSQQVFIVGKDRKISQEDTKEKLDDLSDENCKAIIREGVRKALVEIRKKPGYEKAKIVIEQQPLSLGRGNAGLAYRYLNFTLVTDSKDHDVVALPLAEEVLGSFKYRLKSSDELAKIIVEQADKKIVPQENLRDYSPKNAEGIFRKGLEKAQAYSRSKDFEEGKYPKSILTFKGTGALVKSVNAPEFSPREFLNIFWQRTPGDGEQSIGGTIGLKDNLVGPLKSSDEVYTELKKMLDDYAEKTLPFVK